MGLGLAVGLTVGCDGFALGSYVVVGDALGGDVGANVGSMLGG